MTPENEETLQAKVVVYQVFSEHWAHAEQIRWTLLSNFLVAMSIVLLGWAAVVSASLPSGLDKAAILRLFCFAGIILSLVWLALSMRCNTFVKMYADKASEVEGKIVKIGGAFRAAEEHRKKTIKRFSLLRLARSSYVADFIPVVFLVIYALLLFLGRVP